MDAARWNSGNRSGFGVGRIDPSSTTARVEMHLGSKRRRAPNVTHTVMSETRGRQTVEITAYYAFGMGSMNAPKTVEIIALEQRQDSNMTKDVRIAKFQ